MHAAGCGRSWSPEKPYRGVAPALTDLIGGQAQVMFPSVLSSLEYIRAGTLRVLAVTTAARSQALPKMPTVGESSRATKRASYMASTRPRTRPPRLSRSSIRHSNPPSNFGQEGLGYDVPAAIPIRKMTIGRRFAIRSPRQTSYQARFNGE